MNNRSGITDALSHLTGVARQRGDLDAARSWSARHLRAAQAMGYPFQMLSAITEAADISRALGQMGCAARLLTASKAERETLGPGQPDRMRRGDEKHLRVLHEQVDDESFAAACAGGTALILSETITDALASDDSMPSAAVGAAR